MIAVVPRRLACKDDYLVIVDMPLEVPCFTIAWPGIAIRRINGSGRCALRSVRMIHFDGIRGFVE